MTTAEEILAAAQCELGVKENPMGSNLGRRVNQYKAQTWLDPQDAWPWCVAFAWGWVVWHEAVGKPNPYPTAAVEQLESWARANGWAVKSIIPGDLLCLNHGQHVTIAAAKPSAGFVKCIGGNQSDSVCFRNYRLSEVTTIVRVPKRFGTANPTKPPRYEVVKGEGEKAKLVFTGNLGKAQKVAGNLLRAGARVVRIRKK